jgi:hypothetical protein
MTERRRKFSPQFRAEAVQMVIGTASRSLRWPGTWGSVTGPWATG